MKLDEAFIRKVLFEVNKNATYYQNQYYPTIEKFQGIFNAYSNDKTAALREIVKTQEKPGHTAELTLKALLEKGVEKHKGFNDVDDLLVLLIAGQWTVYGLLELQLPKGPVETSIIKSLAVVEREKMTYLNKYGYPEGTFVPGTN